MEKNEPTHVDALGNQITPGCIVIHGSSSSFAGFAKYRVVNLSKKQVGVGVRNHHDITVGGWINSGVGSSHTSNVPRRWTYKNGSKSLRPDVLVVVENLEGTIVVDHSKLPFEGGYKDNEDDYDVLEENINSKYRYRDANILGKRKEFKKEIEVIDTTKKEK